MQPALARLLEEVHDFHSNVRSLPVVPRVRAEEIRKHLGARFDFSSPLPLEQVTREVCRMMRAWSVHQTHPRCFGLFNPSTKIASVAADALTALYNPQLAVWASSPAANEIEQFVLRWLMTRLGFEPRSAAAHFTTGGAEANLSAVLAALSMRLPRYGEQGLAGVSERPVIYLSEEAHHSFTKIAHITGLGRRALRRLRTDRSLRLDLDHLRSRTREDRRRGLTPLLVAANAGATSSGVIDPLPELAAFCRDEGLWLHVDAAWGGAAALSRRLRPCLSGIELADSVTWDAHKWLSVSMGAGMLFCRHPEALRRSFRTEAAYMPAGVSGTDDPYASTIQWSRRFIGLKVFMTVAEAGAAGLEEEVDRMAGLGNLLREELGRTGWSVLNDTPLPVVCFTHARLRGRPGPLQRVLQALYRRRSAWISRVVLGGRVNALRACITSFRTEPADIAFLVGELNGILRSLRR